MNAIKIAVYLFLFFLSANILRLVFIGGPFQLTGTERAFAPIVLYWLTELVTYGGSPLIYLMVSSHVKECVPIYGKIREICIKCHCPFCKNSTAVGIANSKTQEFDHGGQLNAAPSPSLMGNVIQVKDLELEIIG